MSTDKYALDPGIRAMLVDIGVRPAAVLRRAGLRADLFAGGPVWLAQRDFFDLWRAVEEEASDPNLPLRIEDTFAPEVFATPIFAAMMSADLNTAAQRIATYKRLIGPLRLDVDVSVDTTTIGYSWPDGAEPPATLALIELLFWVQLARTGTRARVVPTRVAAPALPADMAAYRSYLGVDIEQSDRQAVTFSAVDGSRPFLTSNEAIWETFEPELRRRLHELDHDASTARQVRAALLELLPAGRTTMAEVASELAMSTRTLQRRLHNQDTSFQRILDQTREDLARHYLTDQGLGAPEIAFLLGYEETSSFYRAFHSWTGKTPENVRSTAAATG